jgi:hypothetical protein
MYADDTSIFNVGQNANELQKTRQYKLSTAIFGNAYTYTLETCIKE